MTSILRPTALTTYGALDSNAVVDGSPISAFVTRAVGKGANRLALRGDHWATWIWPTNDAGATHWTFEVDANANWQAITPTMTLPKKPGLIEADARIYLRARDTRPVYIQVATRRSLFDPKADVTTALNIIECVGTDDFEPYAYDRAGIPIDPGPFETVQFFMRLERSADDLINTAVYGTPDSGVATTLRSDELTLSGAAWLDTISDANIMVTFVDDDGNPIVAPRRARYYAANTLTFSPRLSNEEWHRITSQGSNFELRGGVSGGLVEGRVAIASLVLATKDREFE